MTIRGGGNPILDMVCAPRFRMGPPPRSFAADAYDCIMVRIRIGSTEYKCVARGSAPDGEFPSDPALLAVHPPSACSGVKALRNTSSAKAASRLASLPFRSLDPFRALREPDRRLPDEERPSPRRTKNRHYRSQRAASDRPAVRLWWQLSGRNRLTRKAPYKSHAPKRSLAAACPKISGGWRAAGPERLVAATPGRFGTFALNDTTIT